MNVFANTVVTLNFSLFDADDELIEQSSDPVSYLHGGYHAIFPKVEQALSTKQIGESASVVLEPDDAFGEYDSELVQVEADYQLAGGLLRISDRGVVYLGDGDIGHRCEDAYTLAIAEVALARRRDRLHEPRIHETRRGALQRGVGSAIEQRLARRG